MKNITPSFNAANGNLEFTIELNLFKRYFPNFAGLIMLDEDLPGCSVKQTKSNTAVVSLPIEDKSAVQHNEGDDSASVRAPAQSILALQRILNSFVNVALKKELNSTEFIPLNGYPIESLQEDIVAAVKAKRKLCIIGEYQEYLDSNAKNVFAYHQQMVEYGTEEYADAVVLIKEGNLDELRKIYKPKLIFVEWC